MLLSTSAAAPPLLPRVHCLVVQQSVLVPGGVVTPWLLAAELARLQVDILYVVLQGRALLQQLGTDVARHSHSLMHSGYVLCQNVKCAELFGTLVAAIHSFLEVGLMLMNLH